MSIEVMTRVWASSQQKGSTLLLLLSIADYANERGIAYPSIETLAQKVRMTTRNVQKLLRKLEESGELIIKPNAGPAGCNLYRIVFPTPANRKGGENFSPPGGEQSHAGGENFSPGGEKSGQGGELAFTRGVNASSPDPSLEPPIDPSVNDNNDNTRAAPLSSSSSQPATPIAVQAENQPQPAARVRLPAAAVAQAAGDRDPAWLAAKAAYENNIGCLTPILATRIKEALRTYPPEWVPLAIERAVMAEKRRWDYVEGILRNWLAEGFTGPGSRQSSKRSGPRRDQRQPQLAEQPVTDSYADLILQ